jgi:hypothetical protein
MSELTKIGQMIQKVLQPQTHMYENMKGAHTAAKHENSVKQNASCSISFKLYSCVHEPW